MDVSKWFGCQQINTNINLDLKFNNMNIQPSTSAKYLGIITDDRLTFKQHIISLENKVARSVGFIAKLSYFLPFNTLITFYYYLFHAHLLYALPV